MPQASEDPPHASHAAGLLLPCGHLSLLIVCLIDGGSRIPCLAHLFSGYVVAVLELVEDQGPELCGIHPAVFGKDPFFGGRVDDPAHDAVEALCFSHLCQLAFHDHRKFVDHRRIDEPALYGRITGTFKLIGHPVAGGDAEEVCRVHVVFVRDTDRECLRLQQVLGGLMVFVNKKGRCGLHCRSCPRLRTSR